MGRSLRSCTLPFLAAGCFAFVPLLGSVAPIAAQERGGERPRLLTFGLSTGITANDNFGLDAQDEEGSVRATTRLDFVWRDSTPIQDFQMSGDVGLRYVAGADDDRELDGLADPSLRFAYARALPESALGVEGFVNRSAVEFLDPLEDFLADPDDPLANPGDLTEALNEGTRLRFGLEGDLELFRTARVGLDLSAGLAGTRYSDVNDPDLVDEDRYRVGAGMRLILDDATRARLGLSYAVVEDDDPLDDDRRETIGLTAGVTRDLPLGEVGLTARAEDSEDGTRYGLSLSSARRVTGLAVSGQVGLTRAAEGGIEAVGGVRVDREVGFGRLGVALDRSVRTGDDDELTVTALSADYAAPIAPRMSLLAQVDYVRTNPTDGGSMEDAGSVGLEVSRDLSRDWALGVGVRHRFEDEGEGQTARDNSLSLNLRRSFSFVP